MNLRRNIGWVGFDIGGATVKSAQAVRVGGEFRMRTGAIVARRERWNPDALTADQPLASADELQAAASICDGMTGRYAAAVLPMTLCEAVQVESDSARPLAAEDLTALVEAETHQSLAGFVVASWPAHLQTNRLNVVTVPESWSNQVSDDLASGAWNCRKIESVPWALARAVAMSDPESLDRPCAVLDWGMGRATLCLVERGAPAFVRCLKDCGFHRAVAAVENALRLPAADAEKVLHRQGLAASSGAADALAESLAESLHRLDCEVRRTLSYWQSQARGFRPELVYLFGGGASLVGVAERLTQLFELPVRVWDLALENTADAGQLPPAHLLGQALAASALAWEAP